MVDRDAEWVSGIVASTLTKIISVLDPRTGETATQVPVTDPSDCDDAVRRAAGAAGAWARTAPAERAAAADVRAAADELAELNERETGKLRDDARGGVEAGDETLVQYSQLGPLHRGRSLQGRWSATDLMVPQPRGVVAVLTPWNDAVAVAAGLLGAALVTGNTVVHKPSERCPQTGRRFAELLAARLPEGVLQIVDGDGTVGARLASAELVDVVAHIGSSATGREIARACAERGAKAVLENGGNDALIVDADVDPGWAAGQIALARSPTRAKPRGAPLGRREPRPGPGSFYPPTVLTDCTSDMLIMREETFGPISPVQVVSDFAAAIVAAADERYGLAATVLTSDMAHA
ncbi:MAG TPA: aldehyde dehydrogenase family protein [Mycobacterium sp.]|nr:aldehyde dehydrogenase family protein [Mycobacterium sp.]HTX97840.1 aldehyde dehydrogenase family protein [Mycobacterium sp.]